MGPRLRAREDTAMANKLFSFFSQQENHSQDLNQIKSFLQLLPVAACLIDKQGAILFANEHLAAVSGFKSASLIGKKISDYGLTLADLQGLLKEKKTGKLLKEMVTQEMEAVHVNVAAAALPNGMILLTFDEVPQYKENAYREQTHFSLVQNYPFALSIQDKKGLCLSWNKHAESLFGVSAATAVGKPIKDCLAHELTSALEVLDQKVKKEQQSTQGHQMSFKNKQGEEISLSVLKVPSFNQDGELVSILTVFEDISARKKEQEESLEKRNLLEAIVDNMPLGMYTRTPQGEMTFFNRQARDIFSEVNLKYSNAANPKQDPAIVQQYALREKQALTEGKIIDSPDEIYIDSHGNEKVLHVIKVPIKYPGLEPVILTLVEDVTIKREQEREITKANSFLTAIIDNAPIGLYARTKQGKMLLRNKKSEEIYGIERDQIDETGKLSHETQEQSNSYLTREAKILESGQPLFIPEEEYITGSGEKRFLQMVKVPVSDSEGNPEFVITMVNDITENKLQQDKIMEVQNLQQAILDNAPVGIYARDKRGLMLLSNKKSSEIYDLINDPVDEKGFQPHETKEQVEEYLAREAHVLQTGEPLVIPEEEYLDKSGKKRFLELIKVPVRDAEGNPDFVITIVNDITENKLQQDKIMEVQNLQQAILDNAPVGIYARGINQAVSFRNKKASEMFGTEPLDVAHNAQYLEREKIMFSNGQVLDLPEEEFETVNGKKMLLHLIKAPIFDKENKPFIALTIAEDITQKKQQEKEIHEAKNFLQNVVDNLPVALSVKDSEGQYIVWNKKSEDLFGVSAKDVIGKDNYRTDISAEQAEFMRDADKRVFASRRELNIAQELISTPTEGVKIMHTVKTPLYTPQGEPDYLLNVSEDITAKTKMEKQIRETGEKNSLLVENAREGILILEDGKVIYANKAACKILGYEAQEEMLRKKFLDFVAPDHQILAQEKYETVVNQLQGAGEPAQMHFVKRTGTAVELEMTAMVSKYLGRKIMIAFLRDVTATNKLLREVRSEKENYKHIFEMAVLPAFVMNSKGYITTMNKAARDLFGLTEKDRNFYRNVYLKPALTLEARRKLGRGETAEMDYVLDFDRAAEKFPNRVRQSGKLPLHLTLQPFNCRDTKDGGVEADCLVTVQRGETDGPTPPSATSLNPLPKVENAPCKPLPPQPVLLPNTQAHVTCSAQFKITDCNDLFCQLCQLGKDELKGHELIKLFAHEHIEQVAEDLKNLPKVGSFENRDWDIHVASGLETVPVRVSALSLKDGKYAFIFRNMAYQKQLMQILQERSAQLSALLEATDGAVFYVHYENGKFGRIEQSNKFLSELIGYEQEDVVTMPFAQLFTSKNKKNKTEVEQQLAKAAQSLENIGQARYVTNLFTKDGSALEVTVTMIPMDISGKNLVMVLLTDLSDMIAHLSQNSKEALELRSMRQLLPGLYLKADRDGRVREATSNLSYLSTEEANSLFLHKTPVQYWPEDAANKARVAIKEAFSVNINTTFEFEWEVKDKTRYFEGLCTPINGQEEMVIWVKDITDRRQHEKNIRELYAISNENKGEITQQVDRILNFGKRVFKAEVGIVMRFNDANAKEMTVVYATPGPFQIERYMMFPVEECLFDVKDDNVVVFADLKHTPCKRCIHKEKGFQSLIAAPLYVGGKVSGALCFASSEPRAHFEEGAEELVGIMSRILSLRIELREASKTLGETSQSFIRTLEYVDLPAVVLDLGFRVTYANNVFLMNTGRHRRNTENKEFFQEFIRHGEDSRRLFESTESTARGNAFQVKLDLVDEHGKYNAVNWDVFLIKDIKGEVEGYGLIGMRQ